MALFTITKVECTAAAFEDRIKGRMFNAACFFVFLVFCYCFLGFFWKPAMDLSTALVGIATFLLGFYYGTSKSSEDKNKTIDKQIQNAADVAKTDTVK